MTASWYDPAMENYVPDPDDYTFQIGGPGDPAYPGGGGGGVNPPSDPHSGGMAFGGEEAVMQCDVIKVIGKPVAGLVVLGWRIFHRIIGSGGSGSHSRVAAGTIPPSPLNTVNATCTSDETSRFLHAREDIAHMTLASRNRAFRNRTTVRVTYSDGASESWPVLSPLSSPFIVDVPVQNSMRGCD